MRLFCAFVRHPTKTENTENNTRPTGNKLRPNVKDYQVREDVQVAMTAIGTRSAADVALEEKESFRLSLLDAKLTGAFLVDANLSNALLTEANLRHTFLFNANLSGAELACTDFSGAKGLTQNQLDQAVPLLPQLLPKLGGLQDPKNGAPLKMRQWRGEKG